MCLQCIFRLRKVFGDDLILFSNDENETSTWCDDIGKPCTSCDDFEVDETIACADRLMTSPMITSITKLAKFILAEWPDSKCCFNNDWKKFLNYYI